MCGIVGYLGKRNAYPVLIKGLKRLEYRGYDSAGVALLTKDGNLRVYKTKGKVADLEAGDYVYISGTVYTARDAAHKRLYEAMLAGKEIPLELKDNIIYYLGPCRNRRNSVVCYHCTKHDWI